ncbi:DNA replication ATP-dependent helicase/nuclease JHS1 [Andrographis paniculata]|uniref:DNA replication ATP-dependent helicase/nuclease JHS1 n=1 Tax=Andrographis paniculata TaxID=175694 RepID=UPI0021E75F17|nr:DNA replication ATP-dependent helicase/nuclease JHS1 [Andrographis paniculata]
MAPRKRATSGGKKSGHQNREAQQPSQPSKFGIQHFFERHSLSQKACSQNAPKKDEHLPRNPLPGSANGASQKAGNELEIGAVRVENPVAVNSSEKIASMGKHLRGHNSVKIGDSESGGSLVEMEKSDQSPITVKENLFRVDGDEGDRLEVSPEASKCNSAKRYKFSPGMLIKQTQDDGVDEVTWKISPVNERLNAMSKHLPGRIRILADSTRFNSMNLQKCSQVQTSPIMSRKLERWLSSPPPKTDKELLICFDKVASRKSNSADDIHCHEKSRPINNNNKSAIRSTQSPFSTPPSLSFCHNKDLDDVDSCGVPDQLGSRQHKKALIELLDQVEDVISVEPSSTIENETFLDVKRPPKANHALNHSTSNSEEHKCGRDSEFDFLVLEVSERHEPAASSGRPSTFKVLHLLNEQSGAERTLHLSDEWYFSVAAPGNTVHVIGDFDAQGNCHVNHEKNYLIVHPELLVSGTRVSASFGCPRRTVLDERLKHSEHSAAALMGTLLHQIFQAALISEFPTKEFLEDYSRTVLQKNLESLFACGVSDNDAWKILIEAIPKILNWISYFRGSQGSKNPSIDFKCEEGLKRIQISEVIDIEEMAWAPKYGLKGMIDASVRVRASINSGEVSETVMPLEFKTGKGTGQVAMEHNAQVMLYTLLMSERYGIDINNGLLYYLLTDQTQGVSARRSDLIGLLMRRNELAADLRKASTTQQLPSMSQSLSMCKSCRHLNVCTIYHKAYGGSVEESGLGDVYASLVSHLTTTHTDFLRTWERLVDLEAMHVEVVSKDNRSENLRNDQHPVCAPSLVLDPSEKSPQKKFSRANRFSYRFVRQDLPLLNTEETNVDYLSSSSSLEYYFKIGDYVILSTEHGSLRVANGVIVDIGNSHVSVSFSKHLRLPRQNLQSLVGDLHQQSWRIEKDEFTTSYAIMRYNLVQLFLPNEYCSRLRKMVVDLEAPVFDHGCVFSQDPAISYIRSEKSLNDDQRKAILKILAAKDYALILGMPGTGKTSTLVHAVKALLIRGSSILLTSYTNSAVDNLLIKLKAQGIDFIRIGREEAVHEDIRENCSSAMDVKTTREIKERLDKVSVVAVTCLGVNSPLLNNKRFDICIMDEAGQITLPVTLGPLAFASKFVLVGDHYQLPPLVQSPEAKENGMGISLFCRLSEAHPQSVAALHCQYRMCAAIMELSNALIYDNRLRCGSAEVENAKLSYQRSFSVESSWIIQVLNPDQPVVFINTDLLPAFETNDGKALNNPTEAYIVAEVVKALLHRGIEGKNIGIITPYNSQANLIRGALSEPVEVHTIDKYQGRDKDCIVLSFVRSRENPRSSASYSSSLLGDWHRINVALTRAKRKLIMVGCCGTSSKVPLLKLLINKVEQLSGMFALSVKDIPISVPVPVPDSAINTFQVHLKRCSNST